MMGNPHDFGDRRTHDPYVPALDGLRGLAAILVAGAHYMTMEGGAPLSEIVQTLTGLGKWCYQFNLTRAVLILRPSVIS
jgi:peptidoglycan/LPS O-acetylase OafA/YrhL